jgi:hypothetical protein
MGNRRKNFHHGEHGGISKHASPFSNLKSKFLPQRAPRAAELKIQEFEFAFPLRFSALSAVQIEFDSLRALHVSEVEIPVFIALS